MSIPRRADREQMTPAELAITAAMEEVEKLPPDSRLTDSVVMLAAAREKVADFVDGVSMEDG